MTASDLVHNTLVKHTAYENARRRLDKLYERAPNSPDPLCLAVLGESRTGKSRLFEEFRADHPTYRIGEGLCVPVLYVSATARPTVPGLVETMLYAIGDPRWNKDPEPQQTLRLYQLLRETQCRMVVVDEFQQIYDKNSEKVSYEVADWLKRLADQKKFALVCAGLPRGRAVIQLNEQLVGRFLAPVQLPRFDWKKDEDKDEFAGILDAFRAQIATEFEIVDLGNPEMAFRCYCATGGLMGYLTKLLNEVVSEASENRRKKITLAHLHDAHEAATWLTAKVHLAENPFDTKFSTAPSEELLQKVKLIGTEDDAAPPRPRGRPRAPKRESVHQALSAS
jgi:hypothetical protein